MDAGGIGEPVVRVDDVEIERAGHDTGTYRVVVYLLDKIVGITAGKLDAPQVVGAHIVKIGIDMVAQTEIEVGGHDIADALAHIVGIDVAPAHGHLRHAHDVGEMVFLIAIRLGDDKGYLHVATLPHAFCETVARGAETAEDVRGKFPPEH